jgi:hypothetical protein
LSQGSTCGGRSALQEFNDAIRACYWAESSDGERVLLHIPTGVYLKLDASSSAIFDLLVKYEDVAKASTVLAKTFSIPADRAVADVGYVISTLTSLRPSRASRVKWPTVHGVVITAREWWSLPILLRIAVVRAVLVVAAAEIGMRTTDLGHLAALLKVPLAPGMSEIPQIGIGGAGTLTRREQRNHRAAGWVLDRWVFDGTCLRRALIVGYFLRRHHPVLRLGLVGDGRTSHAWVEAEGMTFNEAEVIAEFVEATTPNPTR